MKMRRCLKYQYCCGNYSIYLIALLKLTSLFNYYYDFHLDISYISFTSAQ